MNMKELWKSEEEIKKERIEEEAEALRQEIIEERESNLINDTEVLAEMAVMLVMDNETLMMEVADIREKLEELENAK